MATVTPQDQAPAALQSKGFFMGDKMSVFACWIECNPLECLIDREQVPIYGGFAGLKGENRSSVLVRTGSVRLAVSQDAPNATKAACSQ